MREIVWDTETTGFDPASGDRIVEIAAIELHSHMPTERIFHRYINPQRDMPESAYAVHGLSIDFLKNHPIFGDIAGEFMAFIEGATLIAHNAEFDMKFINAELAAVGRAPVPVEQSFDTLALARQKFPGQSNSLDSLCRRFGIDNSHREKHGALLDCELLAEVYLELIGGRQPDLVLAEASESKASQESDSASVPESQDAQGQRGQGTGEIQENLARSKPLPSFLSETERAAHETFVSSELGEKPVWKKFF